MSRHSLPVRQQEALLRLRKRNLDHLEDRLPDMFSSCLGDRFRPRHLLAVGAMGALFIASDEDDLDALVVVKLPLFDWARPGKIATRDLQRLREALRVEARILQRTGGRIMPALVDCFTGRNPLVVEPEPRAAPDECFLVMEWIDGDTVDVVARTVAQRHGPDHVEFINWVAVTTRRIAEALLELRLKMPDFIYYDVAPRNFLMPNEDSVRVVDAGGFASTSEPLDRVPFTAEYCPLTADERRGPGNEHIVTRRLALLGLDLLTDKISRRVAYQSVVEQLVAGPAERLAKLLDECVASQSTKLTDLSQSLRGL